jgi:oxygen-independent coproporphyrinogen-3 oxidase
LIYARPGQTAAAWEGELRQALVIAGDHLSLYQLTIEPGTVFHARHRAGELRPLPNHQQAELFELTQTMTGDAGLPAYEVSSHARSGGESRHNLSYWRYEPYVGIGPGAFGRLPHGEGRLATATRRSPDAWLGAVEGQGHAELERERLEEDDLFLECLLMGLRLAEGLPLRRLDALSPGWRRLLDRRSLNALQHDGLLEITNKSMKTTVRGRLFLDAILRQLVAVGAGEKKASDRRPVGGSLASTKLN